MKYRRCNICGLKVSEKYENSKNLYYCLDCGEFKKEDDTYEVETVKTLNPIVEGTKESGKIFKGFYYCDEYCHFCSSEIYDIPTNRVSLYPECKVERNIPLFNMR